MFAAAFLTSNQGERVRIPHSTPRGIMKRVSRHLYSFKFGFDFHGVIDQDPAGYAELFRELMFKDCEVHIITGAMRWDITPFLRKWGIKYNYIYSITDDLMDKGKTTGVKGKSFIFPDKDWNEAKAKYCKENNIMLMLDDSDIYGKFFETPYYKTGSEIVRGSK